jgi:hypothetical protein
MQTRYSSKSEKRRREGLLLLDFLLTNKSIFAIFSCLAKHRQVLCKGLGRKIIKHEAICLCARAPVMRFSLLSEGLFFHIALYHAVFSTTTSARPQQRREWAVLLLELMENA